MDLYRVSDIEIHEPYAASYRRLLLALSLALLVTACSSSPSAERAAATPPSPSTSPAGLPAAAFADISADAVSKERAEKFQAALNDMSRSFGGAGMAATVLSAAGTWSGAAGKADSSRDVGIRDQFAIGSVTKSLVAAQVMQLVEAGRLGLDDPADRHLPATLDFDTNNVTIRQLVGMRSGIPDYYHAMKPMMADRRRVWTTADMLALVPAERTPAGTTHEYVNTNYVLLQLVIEQVMGRTVVQTMRDGGVLDIDGIERLVYQPDERPTAPMALPSAMSPAEWREGGGYLPSIASATAGPTTGSIATDSLSLARWWQAFCSGKLVSQDSLTTMATLVDGYGLGLTNATPYTTSFGHPGADVGYIAWAGCLPDSGSVIVTLSNTGSNNITLPEPLVRAVEADASPGTMP